MSKVDIFEENRRLRQELEHEKRLRLQWQNRYYALEKELKEVKDLLNQFLNANTPSSQLPPQFKPSYNERPEKGTNPRGKPEGSNGATKEMPEKIDRKIKVRVGKRCKKCGGKLKINKYFRIFYELGEIKIFATEAEIEEGYCEHCDITYTGSHPELPKEGMIGPNFLAFITELKHNFAGSYDKISSFLENFTGFDLSHTALNNCVERVSDSLKPSYNLIKEETQNSSFSHSDETSWPVDGKNWWLWLFITANTVLIMIKNSRTRRVLTDLFGEFYNGTIISDCLKVYQKFAASFQKDWGHLLRKTHFEAKKHPKRNIVRLHEELVKLYSEVVAFLETCPSFEKRVWHSIMYHQKLQRIANYKWRSSPAKNIINDWLKAYEGQWFVGVIIPEVPLTNNINERGIRKVIPTRKLLGGHRTEHGSESFAIIETHRQTWKLRGESPYCSLVEHLKNHNSEAVI